MSEQDRAAIRRHARARAERMGLRTVQPEQEAAPAAVLPTQNVFALRGLLRTGRLVGAQAAAARTFLAEADRVASEAANDPDSTDPTTGDAA